jgi:hypothetical protein
MAREIGRRRKILNASLLVMSPLSMRKKSCENASSVKRCTSSSVMTEFESPPTGLAWQKERIIRQRETPIMNVNIFFGDQRQAVNAPKISPNYLYSKS